MDTENELNPNADVFKEMQAIREGKTTMENEDEPQKQEVSGAQETENRDEVAAQVENHEEQEEPPKKPKYRVGGREFDTQEEAFAYADELDRQAAIREAEANAYRQAYANIPQQQQPQQSVTPEEDDDFDSKFYENPRGYIEEIRQRTKEETKREVLSTLDEQREEEKLWSEFMSENPDLAPFREDCNMIVDQHRGDIQALFQTRGKSAAYNFIAQKTRAKFQKWAEAQKPRRELPNTKSAASQGAPQSVTPKTEPQKSSTFFEQMRSINRKGS